MTRRLTLTLLILMLGLFGGVLLLPTANLWAANIATNYTGVPPYVPNQATPNVLLFANATGGSAYHAVGNPAALAPPYGPTTGISLTQIYFTASINFQSGLFDALQCYTYDGANTRFTPTGPTKLSFSDPCPDAISWDGNFLNYVVTDTLDVLKITLIGGTCAVARAVDGSCPPSGSPSLVTMTVWDSQSLYPITVPAQGIGMNQVAITTAPGPDSAIGRVPLNVMQGGTGVTPPVLYFHLLTNDSPLRGAFCVDSDSRAPGERGPLSRAPQGAPPAGWTLVPVPDCEDPGNGVDGVPGGFVSQRFEKRVAYNTEPIGLVQITADSARFGLMLAGSRSDYTWSNGQIIVPVGGAQAITLSSDPAVDGAVTTWSTNQAATVYGIQTMRGDRGVTYALGQAMYEAARYFAQVNSSDYYPARYNYPIAFAGGNSGGVAFQGTGTGGIGPSEIKYITGAESCPGGYIANACGRDPYFFGSTPQPWTTPASIPRCCQSYILFLGDGAVYDDAQVPVALRDYAHGLHGTHCTPSSDQFVYGGPPAQPPTCPARTIADPPALLMLNHAVWGDQNYFSCCFHAMDDVLYWAHTNDLRPDSGPIAVIGEAGHPVTGFQNLTFYAVNTNPSQGPWAREMLLHATQLGGFIDMNGNNVFDPAVDQWDVVVNATGAAGSDGIPDTYFEATNADEVLTALTGAFQSILKRSAAGTAIGVLSTSSSGEGAVYEAYFFPLDPDGTQVSWIGYLQALFIDSFGNLREDFSAPGCTGAPDGKLILKHDCIVKLRYDSTSGAVKVDRYQDADGDGAADTVAPFQTVDLKDVQASWEGGRRLALTTPGASCAANTGGATCRRILTWADVNNDGDVDVAERLEFTVANESTLCPFLGGALVANCVSGTAAQRTAAQNEATNIINWIRGNTVAGLRNRVRQVTDDAGVTGPAVWPLGDIMSSSPTSVGAPSERYDAIYGDANYSAFFARYKDRRQVVYAGANDGMLHAFNGGYFANGDVISTPDKEELRFTTTPKQPGTTTNCASLPCDGSVATYAYRGVQPPLGAELWAFIPQDLLPQLRWLTDPAYSHIYYVDQKPKVTDARIFAPDADHPGGWGTILIGGFRFGGSCRNCTNKGVPRVVNADFDGSGIAPRVFLSSYFVLDITNPEKDPVLLWTFRDQDLGLTTAQPAVVRIKPTNTLADPKTASTNEKWFVVFGTGPTNFDADSSQPAQMYAVDLKVGPPSVPADMNTTNGTVKGVACSAASPCLAAKSTGSGDRVRIFPTGLTNAFMGDATSLDFDLDFRVDVIYIGSVRCAGATPSPCNGVAPVWKGAMWRLVTNGDTDPDNWGIHSGPDQKPTKLISTFTSGGTCADTTAVCANKVGPVTAAPALSSDDTHNIWVFFGTGRYFSNLDKTNTDPQQFFGVKDCFITGVCADQTVEQHNLLDVSQVVVCTSCTPTANVSTDGGGTFTVGFQAGGGNLVNNIQNMDGWVTNLPNVRERNFTPPTILGGTLFFTTFIPSDDLCVSGGNGLLYNLYYGTGTPFSDSMIGTTVVGANTIANASLSLGFGMPSQAAVQIGAQGTGAHGTTSNTGCVGRVTAFVQAGTGAINQFCSKPALSPWSRLLSWRDL